MDTAWQCLTSVETFTSCRACCVEHINTIVMEPDSARRRVPTRAVSRSWEKEEVD